MAEGFRLSDLAYCFYSTFHDGAAQYSPDGRRIVFESERKGQRGIWASDADGSKAEELFSGRCGSPQWSPDGERVAYDCIRQENTDIYVMRASGGKPIQLTNHPADDVSPTWSRDGNWVYLGSSRTGRIEIWKVSGGGEAIQMTRNGGETAYESPDGKYIYYVKQYFSSDLWKMPVNGGEESRVLPSVVSRAFLPERAADAKFSIQFLSLATGIVNTVSTMSEPPGEGLSVSADGRSLLFSQFDEAGSDLMLMANFR